MASVPFLRNRSFIQKQSIMRNTKKNIQKAFLLIGLLLITSTGFAQLPGFDDSQNDSQPAPISSIVALGLVAGAVYGVRKIR